MNFAREGFRAAYVKHTIWSDLYNQGTGSTQQASLLRDCSPLFYLFLDVGRRKSTDLDCLRRHGKCRLRIKWTVTLKRGILLFLSREEKQETISFQRISKALRKRAPLRSFRVTCIITRCNLRHKLQFSVIIQAFFPRPGFCFNDILINWM